MPWYVVLWSFSSNNQSQYYKCNPFLQIKTPREFNVKSKKISGNKKLRTVQTQSVIPIESSGCGHLLNGEDTVMTYAKFHKLAGKMEEEYQHMSENDLEDIFWQRNDKDETLYAMDIELSLFADDCKTVNLNKFTAKESLLHLVC